MDVKEIKRFPDDVTLWLVATAAEGDEGTEVLLRWQKDLDRLRAVLKAHDGLLEFEWEIVLCDFKHQGAHAYVGWKIIVKIVNTQPSAEVTYIFRLNDENKIVEMEKCAGRVDSDNHTPIQ